MRRTNERPGFGFSSSTSISAAGASSSISIRTVEIGSSTRYFGRSRRAVATAAERQHPRKGLGSTGLPGGEVKSVSRLSRAMAVKSTAEAVWENDLPHGHGRVKGKSGGLAETAVSWAARTGTMGGQTTPEELLAAAHASCFSMALSGGLGRMQKPPTSLKVSATATFDKVGEAWKVTTMELVVVGKVAGITAAEFESAAQAAAQGCPMSGVMKGNVVVSVHASLE
jgi:lipoyl-dependent peroxiredoxin